MAEKRGSFTSQGSASDAGRQSSPSGEAASGSSRSAVHDVAKKMPTSAAEFDRMFDDGEDIDHLIDWPSAERPGLKIRRVNLDLPAWMIEALDRHAERRGVARQALIKMWLADRLEAAV
jgi:hypothetical protein